jgi:hypothetical protein
MIVTLYTPDRSTISTDVVYLPTYRDLPDGDLEMTLVLDSPPLAEVEFDTVTVMELQHFRGGRYHKTTVSLRYLTVVAHYQDGVHLEATITPAEGERVRGIFRQESGEHLQRAAFRADA